MLKIYIIIAIVGLIVTGVYFGYNHYEALVAKASQVDQLTSELEASNKRYINTQRLLDKADDLLKEQVNYATSLEQKLLVYQDRKNQVRQDPDSAKFLSTSIPGPVGQLLCESVGSYKQRTDCNKASGPTSNAAKPPTVRKENK